MKYILLLAVLLTIAACSRQGDADKWPAESWENVSPGDSGVNLDAINRVQRSLQSKMYGYIDHFLVVRDGYLLVDKFYDNDYARINRGRDEESTPYNYYSTEWYPYYQDSELHTLQSVTKSVTALVIGAALQRGDFPPIDTIAIDYFAGYQIEDQELKGDITIEDLLTMRSGIFWNEWDYEVSDERNTVTQMENSDDWIQYVLDLPMSHPPGETFVYNSGSSQMLSAIFKNATGQHVDEYARKQLFDPLGIGEYFWKKTPGGFADTEGGLYLKAEDLAKIGHLVLQNGSWDGH